MVQEPFQDDPLILNDDWLLRRVHPKMVVPDENLGISRPSSQNFQDTSKDDPMSVYQNKLLATSTDILTEKYKDWGVIRFTAGFARSLNQVLIPDTGPDPKAEPDPHRHAHALMCGKKTHSVRNKLSQNCEWVKTP